MTQPDERYPTIPELMEERRVLVASLKQIFDDACKGAGPGYDPLRKLISGYADSNQVIEELMLCRLTSTAEAVKWMKEEIGMLRAQVRDLSERNGA